MDQQPVKIIVWTKITQLQLEHIEWEQHLKLEMKPLLKTAVLQKDETWGEKAYEEE